MEKENIEMEKKDVEKIKPLEIFEFPGYERLANKINEIIEMINKGK